MRSEKSCVLIHLLILCSLGIASAADSAGITTASSTLTNSATTISSTLSDSTTSIAASLTVESSTATTMSNSLTSAASSIADSTTSASSTIADSTTSASSTFSDSTSSAASSLGGASLLTGSGGASSTTHTNTSPCGPGTGTVCQDPHFVGYDGSVYDFQGVPNKIFSLVSDSILQINSLFSEFPDHMAKKVKYGGKTWLSAIGVKCFNSSVIVSHPSSLQVDINESEDSVMLVQHSSSVNIVCGDFWNVTISNQKEWTTGGYILRLHAVVIHLPAQAPHGVLGQTLRYAYAGDRQPHPVNGHGLQGKGVVEGTMEDYIVHDGILGNEFKFNKFGVAEKRSRTVERRFMYKGANV